jgi:pimeloyl-ACP methyl ester carboxylesterase
MNNLIYALKIEKIDMFDESRKRNIPVVIYKVEEAKNKQLFIINHGYGLKNTEYSFIANALAQRGYYVASIQHDLETDKRPKTGTLFARRMPFWERGVQNILFVIDGLKKMEPKVDLNKVILIGHSNGGDISMMFATLYPNKVSKIISLDSRRYPFPRNTDIEILRFGASDDEPDEGVVPNSGVQVIYVKDAKHNDLCDMGSRDIKDEIQKSTIWFLVR